MSKLTFVDVTLRDGNHSIRQQFTPEIAGKVAAALDAAGVEIIEVGHGDGVGGSSIHVGRTAAPYQQLVSAVVSSVKRAKVAIMLLPGFGTKDDLQQSYDLGATVARVACHCNSTYNWPGN
jgi:4-hydroxy 2-oxovalerate aldolase